MAVPVDRLIGVPSSIEEAVSEGVPTFETALATLPGQRAFLLV